MKIAVYTVETVTPKDENEYYDICDIINLPSLKYGTAEFIGKFSHWITKAELKQMSKVTQNYYDREYEIWRNGVLLTNSGQPKLFAQYAGQL